MIGHDFVNDCVEFRPPAPIAFVGNENDLPFAIPAREFERSDADGQCVIWRGVDIGIACQKMLRQQTRIRTTARKKRDRRRRIRLFEMIDDGVLIWLIDLHDLIEPARFIVGRIVDDVRAEHDVVGIERHAVRPRDAVPDMIGDRQSVFAYAAVRSRGHRGCKFRIWTVVFVPFHEPGHRHLG